MLHIVLNRAHLDDVLGAALAMTRHRLFIATADVKNLQLPAAVEGKSAAGGPRSRSILAALRELAGQGVEVRLLHSGVPSGPFLHELKGGSPATFRMRRCPRVHVKAVIVDGSRMYLGSANLTGAGLGAKGRHRRNFEAGVWTDEVALIDPVADMLDRIWGGEECARCGRKAHCPEPLEEPGL